MLKIEGHAYMEEPLWFVARSGCCFGDDVERIYNRNSAQYFLFQLIATDADLSKYSLSPRVRAARASLVMTVVQLVARCSNGRSPASPLLLRARRKRVFVFPRVEYAILRYLNLPSV